jgi:hypothetical protein
MTAPSVFMGFAAASLVSLLVSTAGLAETRLMSDPNGGLVATAPTDGVLAGSTAPDASAPSVTAPPIPAAAIGASTDALAGSGMAQEGPAADATAPVAVGANLTATAPQSGWSQLFSKMIEFGGAASR